MAAKRSGGPPGPPPISLTDPAAAKRPKSDLTVQRAGDGGGEPKPKWLGHAAVLWALDDAPGVPPHLVAALVAVARHSGEDGRGAYPSVTTVAGIIRKTERATQKDLAALRQLGLLLRGDQRLAAWIRADKRPFVYDLPMPRGEPQGTPQEGHGVNHRTERGEPQGPSGVNHRTPEEFLKNSGRIPGPRADTPRDDLIRIIIDEIRAATGHTIGPQWAARTARLLLDGRDPANAGGYVRAAIRAEKDPRTRFLSHYDDQDQQ